MHLPGARPLGAGLLGAAVLALALAWQVQTLAADDLARAHAIGQQEVPEDDSPPPRLEDYRAILETIERSVVIRRRIDGLLERIETTVAGFERQQQAAETITAQARADLESIAQSLSSSIAAARASTDELTTLEHRLGRAADLARRIAEELEELDQSLGPTVGIDR